MPDGLSRDRDRMFDGQCVGIILLLIVNVLWVLSAELTRFIFVDEDFKRPFFTAYVKTCMLVVYMVKYLCSEAGTASTSTVRSRSDQNLYKVLANDASDCESFDIGGCDNLTAEGFETVTDVSDAETEPQDRPEDVDSEGQQTARQQRRSIRFAPRREVRRMPSSEAEDARRARLPYSPQLECPCPCPTTSSITPAVKYTVLFFAPMWLLCTFTYQTALLFTSVSSLNLISSSSSLFVLLFSICIPSKSSKFTLFKAFLVAMNLTGVVIVSQFSASLKGAILAQISAISYAIYLTLYTRYQERNGDISINLMFGSIGVLAICIGSPMLFVLDVTGVEKLYPLPNWEQLGSVVLSALFGTLLADYLWLIAAGLTNSLSASLSLTLSIPFSFLADTVFRQRPPTLVQLLAAIPITMSFAGAAVADHKATAAAATAVARRAAGTAQEDSEALLEDQD